MPTEDHPRADPLAEHRQRARWRLIGAFIFSVFAFALSYSVLLDTPRPLARDFTVLMPIGSSPEPEPVPASEPVSASEAVSDPGPQPVSAPVSAPVSEPVSAPAPEPVPEPVSEPQVEPKVQPYVQVGAYASRPSAEQVKRRLEAAGHKVVVSPVGSGSAQRFRVRIGPLSDEEAKGVVARAKLQGYDAVLVKGTAP